MVRLGVKFQNGQRKPKLNTINAPFIHADIHLPFIPQSRQRSGKAVTAALSWASTFSNAGCEATLVQTIF
jgi:hypothetical protein